MKKKVYIYITRDKATQLLVFKHRDYPDAGIQVPGGSVEKFERIESAIYRETFEESGLKVLSPKLIGDCEYLNSIKSEKQHRYFFHCQPEYKLDDAWSFTVKGGGEDKNLVFEYFWLECNEAEKVLEIDQGMMIKYI